MSVFIKKILLGLLISVVTLPAMAEKTILVIGDSLSSAYGMQPEQSWVALLQQRLQAQHYDYKVVNASITGDTTSNGVMRVTEALTLHHPDVTIVALGGNDGLRGISLVAMKKNLNRIVAQIKEAKSRVLILGVRLPPNYGPAYTEQFQQLFTEVAKENNVSVVPQMLHDVDEKEVSFQADRIHPTAAAQPTLLNNIWPALQAMLTH
jgi:acyl-CoA thioesterase-1